MGQNPCLIKKYNVVRKTPGLTEVMGDQNNRFPGFLQLHNDGFDSLCGDRIKAGCRLVQEQDFRLSGQHARKRQPLLLAP